MKTTKTLAHTEEGLRPMTEKSPLMSKLPLSWKKLYIARMLAATLSSGGIGMAQNTSTPLRDPAKTEIMNKTSTGGAFSLDHTFSPVDKGGTTKLSGSKPVRGVDAGGSQDLTGTPDKPSRTGSAFGKFTASKSIACIPGVSVAIEYTLSSSASQIKTGIIYKHKLADGKIIFKLYPLSDKGLEPFVLVGADHKLGKKLFASASYGTDIKSKSFHGEAESTYKISKHVTALAHMKVGGTYTTKPKVGAYIGMRIKF